MNAYTLPVDYVDLNAPAEVVDIRVEQTPNANFCFVTLRNLGKPISQAHLMLYLFDLSGTALGPPVDAVIQNLSVPEHGLFGENCPIPIGSLIPATVHAEVVSITSEDGELSNPVRNIVSVLSPVIVAPQDMKYLHMMAGKDAVNLFSQNNVLWRCVCGRTNSRTDSVCRRCGRDYVVVKKYDMNGLISRRAVEQRAERSNAPAPQPYITNAEQNKNAEPPKKKSISAGAVFVIIVSILILCSATYFAYDHDLIGPGMDYKQGMTYFEQGRYTEAHDCFAGIKYKDSDKMALYAEGFELANHGKPDEAAAIFEQLGNYKDSIKLKDDYRYEHMQNCINKKEYYAALEMARLLRPSGRVDDKMYNEIIFNAAGEMQRQNQPDVARSLYEEVSSVYPVTDQLKECDYQMAVSSQDLREFEDAIQLFSSISSYRDSSSRMQECKYNWAKELASEKKYKESVDLFGELGNFRDSKDLFNETCYQAGKDLAGAGNKAGAQEFFNMIPDYKDAGSYVVGKQEYDYRKAVELRNSQKYDLAAEAFLALKDYRDSAQLAILCKDDALNEASPFSELEAVMHELEGLGTYGDAADRLSSEKYLKIRLAGSWKDKNGNSFSLTLVGDAGYYIQTSIPIYQDIEGSRFNGYVYEVNNGNSKEFKPQFEFRTITEKKCYIYNYTDNVTYTFHR